MKNYWLDKKQEKFEEAFKHFDPCFTLDNFPTIIGGTYNPTDIKFDIPVIPDINFTWEMPTELLDNAINLPPIIMTCIVGPVEVPFEGIPMSGYVLDENNQMVKAVDWGTPPEFGMTITVTCPTPDYIQQENLTV